MTSGPVLDDLARAALEPWLRAGGGLVGLHSASATELDWPFFVDELGAQFLRHPPWLFAATVRVDAPAHPHPIAWAHQRFGGRAFYTALGHTPESYAEPAFLALVAQAIEWTAAGHPRTGGAS